MSDQNPITRANVKAFLARPWDELGALKREHWRAALEADPLATFNASAELWEMLNETGHTTNEVERRADLESHLRLRALLDRTAKLDLSAHVRSR